MQVGVPACELQHFMTAHFLDVHSTESSIHDADAEQVGEEQGRKAKQAQQEYKIKLASSGSDVEVQDVPPPSPGEVLCGAEPCCVVTSVLNLPRSMLVISIHTLVCINPVVHQDMLMV